MERDQRREKSCRLWEELPRDILPDSIVSDAFEKFQEGEVGPVGRAVAVGGSGW